MKQKFSFFLKYASLWIIFFLVTKGIFLIYQYDQSQHLNIFEIAKIFLHGLRMDLSATGYILLIPGLLLCLTPLLPPRWFINSIHGYTAIMSIFLCLITTLDFELFRNWGFRFDVSPLKYIGKESLASSEFLIILLLTTLFLVLLVSILFLYWRLTRSTYIVFTKSHWSHSPVYLLATAFLILPIRGSLDIGPMNTGTVFFHKKNPFANQAAINLFWNFGDSVTKSLEEKNYPENFLDPETTKSIFNNLYANNSSDTIKLIIDNPNVLLIILESFTAKTIATLGGLEEVTPTINALSKEGVLFENFYSSGSRTDKGLISILSGFPAQPKTSIITYTNKTKQLPKLNHEFLDMGYTTSFIYGGDINFANINSYLNMCMFDNITSKHYFDTELSTSKWGVHDGIVFDSLYSHILRNQQPFFTTLLTLSSHEPFDVPLQSSFYGETEESKYLNSVHYTDKELGEFISKFKKTALWDNTLVIITADHGSRHPNNNKVHEVDKFHIPMLWVGGALNVIDTVISKYSSQTDLAATLLNQLGKNSSQFNYSKNIFSESSKSFSFYDFNNGFGYIDDHTQIIYDLNSNQVIKMSGDSSKLINGKAYMQTIFSDFNKK
ncbi:MAG: LTA synthase family protein [Cyclobacteriaceae bacterium]|nr:LTA synthase family protein [Cyclobacteriaceae bacterium]